MVFEDKVKNWQATAYNGARTVVELGKLVSQIWKDWVHNEWELLRGGNKDQELNCELQNMYVENIRKIIIIGL